MFVLNFCFLPHYLANEGGVNGKEKLFAFTPDPIAVGGLWKSEIAWLNRERKFV